MAEGWWAWRRGAPLVEAKDAAKGLNEESGGARGGSGGKVEASAPRVSTAARVYTLKPA